MSTPTEIVVPLLSRRRQRAALVQKFQHVVAGVFLLFQGLTTLGRHPDGAELAIAIVEVVTSAALMAATVRALRRLRRPAGGAAGHAHHGVDWMDVLIAAVLGAEALEHWHTTHHLPRPTILLAVSLLAIGLLHGRLAAAGARRRALRVGPTGVSLPRRRFFARETFPWEQIARITIGVREAAIESRTGRRRVIELTDLDNAGQVVAALEHARSRLASMPPADPPVAAIPESPVIQPPSP